MMTMMMNGNDNVNDNHDDDVYDDDADEADILSWRSGALSMMVGLL